MTPTEENKDEKVRMGLVQISDGKSRPRPARLVLTMEAITIQEEVVVPAVSKEKSIPNSRERMVQLTRQKVGGLGLSIKGGAEHKLPILISKIYKDQAADQTGQLFVGDAVIKVNGEYITACRHDDAVSILRNAGDIVVLTVKHYRAATPFLMKQAADSASDTESVCGDDRSTAGNGAGGAGAGAAGAGDVDLNCNSEQAPQTNGGWQFVSVDSGSRPGSAPPEVTKWKDVVTVPLMMGYVTRYVHGTDKLRPGAMEVRGAAPGVTSGVIHIEQPAALSYWLKAVSDNILGLTSLQVKLLNRQLPSGERIEHAGWAVEAAAAARRYHPVFLVLKGTDLMFFEVPPMTIADLSKCTDVLKVYQTMFRTVKESETVDWRVNCFVIQASGGAAWRRASSCCASRPPGRTTCSTASCASGRRRSRWCTAGARRASRWTGAAASRWRRARPTRSHSGPISFRNSEDRVTTASQNLNYTFKKLRPKLLRPKNWNARSCRACCSACTRFLLRRSRPLTPPSSPPSTRTDDIHIHTHIHTDTHTNTKSSSLLPGIRKTLTSQITRISVYFLLVLFVTDSDYKVFHQYVRLPGSDGKKKITFFCNENRYFHMTIDCHL